MAVAEIRIYPDPVLKKKAAPIERIDERVARLAADMAETMYAAPGVGLAAPQIGVSERLICIDVRGDEKGAGLITLINPEIVAAEGEWLEEEGCLSLPGIREDVPRAERLVVRGWDLRERQVTLEADGLLARALQHEIDHLDGILFIDRLSRLKRGIIERKIRKGMQKGAVEGKGRRLF